MFRVCQYCKNISNVHTVLAEHKSHIFWILGLQKKGNVDNNAKNHQQQHLTGQQLLFKAKYKAHENLH